MMKKLLILFLGLFTCFNAHSQLYIAHVYTDGDSAGAIGATYFLTISAPDGITSTIEIPSPYYYVNGVIVNDMSGHIQAINTELNTIINQGYSLVHVNNISGGTLGGLTYDTYYLAAP